MKIKNNNLTIEQTQQPDEAVATFNQGFNCAQAVLSTFAPSLGLDKTTSLKLTTGFPFGLGYKGETCGAVIAGYLVLGLLAGNSKANDELRKEMTYGLIREFTTEFKKRHKFTSCNDLLGIRIETQEGYDKAVESGVFDTLCHGFV
ncbi:MAG: C_GCAxxG_C_C family protein, partial [Bacteroidia bacterium]|nr:C_GCAxxG_C_C family protein [Bacteroidia bacterium]